MVLGVELFVQDCHATGVLPLTSMISILALIIFYSGGVNAVAGVTTFNDVSYYH